MWVHPIWRILPARLYLLQRCWKGRGPSWPFIVAPLVFQKYRNLVMNDLLRELDLRSSLQVGAFQNVKNRPATDKRSNQGYGSLADKSAKSLKSISLPSSNNESGLDPSVHFKDVSVARRKLRKVYWIIPRNMIQTSWKIASSQHMPQRDTYEPRVGG